MKIKNFIKSFSIRARIIFIFVLITVITLTTLGFGIFSSWVNSAHEITAEMSESTNEEINRQIDGFFENPLEQNGFNQNLIANNYVDMLNQEERERFFILALSQYDEQVYSLGYGTVDGEYYGARINEFDEVEIMRNNSSTGGYSWYYSITEDLTADERVVVAGLFDPRIRPWYTEAVTRGESVFSPVYKHFIMEDLTVSLSTPIYDDSNTLQGVLGAHMILSNINEFLSDTLLEGNGTGIIIDMNTNELIANSMGELNYRLLEDDSVERIKIDELSDQTFQSAYQYYLDNQSNGFYLDNDKSNNYYSISEIHEEGIDWIVITSIPKSTLFSSIINNIIWMGAISILSLIFMIVIFRVFITRIFKPIDELVEVSQAYAKGNFSNRVTVYDNNELSELAKSYNSMAESIDNFVRNLESLVEERTRKLETVNNSLKESEQRFKILHNASFGGIAVHDKGYILDCNQGLSDITGYTIEELIGMNGLLLIAPNYRDFVMDKIKTGYEKAYEAFGIRKNGEIYPLKLEARNIPYNNKVVRVVEFRDITEIKQQEEERKESEKRYQLLYETMNQGVVFHDSEGKITSCNSKAELILGLSLSEMQGKTSMDPRWKMMDEDMKPISGDNHPSSIAFRNKEKVGPHIRAVYRPDLDDHIWLSIVAIPLFVEGEENPNQVYATFEDITEKRNSELKLKQSKERLETVMDNLPIGIAVNTYIPNVKFEYMNDSFPEVYGVSREDLEKDNNFWQAIYEDKAFRETLQKEVVEDILSKDPKRMNWKDIPIKREGEETRYINAYASLLPNTDMLISSVIDVTETKRKEQEIIHISNHDYLTSIPNRRYYQEQLIKFDNLTYYPLGMIIMDVNGLKLLNDAFGHDAGNEALTKIASTINEIKREMDFPARIGGDEFALICPNIGVKEIEKLIDLITKKVNKKTVKEIELSLAIGYAIKTNEEESIRSILTKAENNMYKNKVVTGHSIRNDAIHSIFKTLIDKYHEEKVHSERVSQFCQLLGQAMNFRKDEVKELTMAGLYHDIGKIAIPDAILYKPGRLTDGEWKIMKNHTINGYQILRAADRYSNIAEYAMSHHERIDGKGYPNGISGEDIPLFARIICVADSYEAMTSDRPYRKALNKKEAIKELKTHSGTQFDSDIVKVFIEKVLKDKSI